MTEPTEPQGSCEVCFRRDPKPGEGVVCWPCRQRARDWLDETVALWTNELPDEILTRSGRLNFLAMDLMIPVPSIHSHRLRDGVTDGLVPHIITERVVVPVEVGGTVREVVTYDRRLVRNEDGSPTLVPAGDQTGEIPILLWLDQWVRYWRDLRAAAVSEALPAPTMDRLTWWLRNRVDWAADSDPAFPDFCAELAEQVGMLRRVTGMAPQPVPVPCPNPRCDMLTLVRWPYSKWDVCRNPRCGQMVGPRRRPGDPEPKPGEYDDLVTEAVEALEMEQGGAA